MAKLFFSKCLETARDVNQIRMGQQKIQFFSMCKRDNQTRPIKYTETKAKDEGFTE